MMTNSNLLHAGPHGPKPEAKTVAEIEIIVPAQELPVVVRPKKVKSLQSMMARDGALKVDIAQLSSEVIDNASSHIVNVLAKEPITEVFAEDIGLEVEAALGLAQIEDKIDLSDATDEDHIVAAPIENHETDTNLFGEDIEATPVIATEVSPVATIHTTVIDIDEQFSPIKSSVENTITPTTNSKASSGFPTLVNVSEVPEFKGVVLGLLSEHARASCIVLDVGCAEVAIICTREFYGSGAHTALLNNIGGVRYLFKVTSEYFAGKAIIDRLKIIGDRRAFSNKAAEIINETNRFIVLYDDIVAKAVELKATDIHFELSDTHTSVVRLRIYGRLKQWKSFATVLLQGALTAAYSSRNKAGTNSASGLNLECAMNTITQQQVNGVHYNGRLNGYPLVNGYDVVMRLLKNDHKSKIPSIGDLGYSDFHIENQILPAIRRNAGLMLIAGSTGSGKSTALRSFIYCIPSRDELKIYGVEDPTEYINPFMRQISVQRNSDDKEEVVKMQFLSALRSVLRMDPDALMLGEIRDHASASIASEFNRTGHRVFSTVHGDGAVDVLARLTSEEIGISPGALASKKYLSAVMYQKLLPKLCEHCKLPALKVIPKKTADILRSKYLVKPETMFCANPDGCEHCRIVELGMAGTKGLTVVAEILTPNDGILSAIRNEDWALVEKMWRGQRAHGFDHEDMAGKTAYEHALYKACIGMIDPMDIEADFEPFETYQVRDITNTEELEVA